MTPAELIRAAAAARENAYAPYSNYEVGAVLLTRSGKIYTGCNVESASYGLTVCAERVAFFKAVSEGATDFESMAIVTRNGASMCGACRQVAREFAPDLVVHLGDASLAFHSTTLAHLLPDSFGPDSLTEA